jgi:hypothetical protein
MYFSLRIHSEATRAVMKNRACCCLLLIWLVASATAIAATGKITDSATGAPIAGATVYAVWYYHPVTWPLPIEASHANWACGGTAVVMTDRNGEYDVGPAMSVNIALHEAKYWIVAPGYYDSSNRRPSDTTSDFERLLSVLTWHRDETALTHASRTLTPLADRPVDVRLLALEASANGADNCVAGIVEPYKALIEFKAEVQKAVNQVLCIGELSNALPRTDVFRSVIPLEMTRSVAWRETIVPLLPAQKDQPIGKLALRNACAAFGAAGDSTDHAAKNINKSLTLHITVRDAMSGEGAAGVPIRILWGSRSLRASRTDRDHPDLVPRTSTVLITGSDGTADMPITQVMFNDQGLQPNDSEAHFKFVVVPLAFDRVAFDPGIKDLGDICRAEQLLGNSPRLHSGMRLLASRESCQPGSSAFSYVSIGGPDERPRAQGAPIPATSAAKSSATANQEYQQLNVIAHRETARRKTTVAVGGSTVVDVYRWQWPARALLSRTYEQLALQPDSESSPGDLLQLQRSELQRGFDSLCSQPDLQPIGDAYAVLRELWWIEVQTADIATANRNAQQRAMAWDNGPVCEQAGSASVEPKNSSRPALLAEDVCRVWRADRARFNDSGIGVAHPMPEFQVDYSQRKGACAKLDRFGSSL